MGGFLGELLGSLLFGSPKQGSRIFGVSCDVVWEAQDRQFMWSRFVLCKHKSLPEFSLSLGESLMNRRQ